MADSQAPQQQQAPQQESQAQPDQAPSQPDWSVGGASDQRLSDGLEAAVRQLQSEQGKGAPDKAAEPASPEQPAPPTPKAAAFAALHRRERQLAQQQQEFAKQRDEVQAQLRDWESLKANGKRNPMAALKALGWEDGQEFLKHIAETGGKWTPEQQELAELKSKLAEREKREAEWTKQQEENQAAQQYQQKVDSWHKEIANYARTSDRWKDSLAVIPGTEQLAFQAIADHYEKTQQTLPYDSALQMVTGQLQGQLTSTLEAVAATTQGREMLTELAKKLGVVQATSPRSKPTPAHKQGLSGPIQQTQSGTGRSTDDLSLDEALAANSTWLKERAKANYE